MSPEARTVTPPPGAVRRCVACGRTWPLGRFGLIDPGRGTIDRRRVCRACLGAVDVLLRRGGVPVAVVARSTGVSVKTVRARRAELGLAPASRVRCLVDTAALADLTRQGVPVAVIAERLGVSVETVRKHQVRDGLREPDPRFGRRVPADVLARAGEMLVEGASYMEVERTVGVRHETLAAHFPGLGWSGMERGRWASWCRRPRVAGMLREVARAVAA